MKTFSQLTEDDGYSPNNAEGERRFFKKHKVKKIKDANKNDDKLFNASNIKHTALKEPHGRTPPPKDSDVYEQFGELSEVSRKMLGKYISLAMTDKTKHTKEGDDWRSEGEFLAKHRQYAQSKDSHQRAVNHYGKAAKREVGIATAVAKSTGWAPRGIKTKVPATEETLKDIASAAIQMAANPDSYDINILREMIEKLGD